jgi:hypothetical protein
MQQICRLRNEVEHFGRRALVERKRCAATLLPSRVSHQETLKGTPGKGCCLAGFIYRVAPVIGRYHEIASVKDGKVISGDIAKVKSGSFYAKLDESHVGIVIKVTPPKKGRAADDRYPERFLGQGRSERQRFRRLLHNQRKVPGLRGRDPGAPVRKRKRSAQCVASRL